MSQSYDNFVTDFFHHFQAKTPKHQTSVIFFILWQTIIIAQSCIDIHHDLVQEKVTICLLRVIPNDPLKASLLFFIDINSNNLCSLIYFTFSLEEMRLQALHMGHETYIHHAFDNKRSWRDMNSYREGELESCLMPRYCF